MLLSIVLSVSMLIRLTPLCVFEVLTVRKSCAALEIHNATSASEIVMIFFICLQNSNIYMRSKVKPLGLTRLCAEPC